MRPTLAAVLGLAVLLSAGLEAAAQTAPPKQPPTHGALQGKASTPGGAAGTSAPGAVASQRAAAANRGMSDADLQRIRAAIQAIRSRMAEKLKQDELAGKTTTPLTRGGGLSGIKSGTSSPALKGSPETGASVDKRMGGSMGMSGGPVTPGKYRDTYGGQRINSKNQHSTGDYSGGGQGQTSEGDSDKATIEQMLRDGGGEVTGDPQTDAEEAAYMMSVGVDGWNATKDMTSEQRSAYWNSVAQDQRGYMSGGAAAALASNQRKGGYDNPDADPSGNFIPFGTPEMQAVQMRFVRRAIAAHNNKADGGGSDPRTDQTTGGTGTAIPQYAKDDKAQREHTGGTINWDRVLQINQLVNPPR